LILATFILKNIINTTQKPITQTPSNSLTPVSTESVKISTIRNAISSHLDKTAINKKDQSVISSSSREITTDLSENLTEHSPNHEQSNSTNYLPRKRIADSQLQKAEIQTLFIPNKRLGKMEQKKKFSQGNLNSDPAQITREFEYTRSLTMENQQIKPSPQASQSAMDFTPTADTPGWAREFMQRFAKQDAINQQVNDSIGNINKILAELYETKAELSTVKEQLDKVTAERDALKRKFLGTGASIHAGNMGPLNEDQREKEITSSNQTMDQDQQQEFPRLNAEQPTMAQRVRALAQQPVQQRKKRVTQGQRKAAARVFMEPSGESGFTSVYLPCRRRMPISELRGNLRKLKIANFRVLDVSYPAQKVVALLVHQEYAKELMERFETAGVKAIDGFDPLDPKVLSDPNWVDKSEDERAVQVQQIHRVRCLVALDHIRIPAKYAVARHFVRLGWVESETLQRMQTGDKLAPPREQDDEVMNDSYAAANFREESEPIQGGADTASDFTSSSRASSAIPTDVDSGRSNE
jgi:hypothetical protein